MNALLGSGALRRGRAPRTDDPKPSEPLVAIRNLKLEASTARGTAAMSTRTSPAWTA